MLQGWYLTPRENVARQKHAAFKEIGVSNDNATAKLREIATIFCDHFLRHATLGVKTINAPDQSLQDRLDGYVSQYGRH